VSEFGPPASTFRMNSGEMSYVWQLSNETDINVDKNGGSARTYFCRVNVIAAPAGIVTRLTTEDVSGTGGILRTTTIGGASRRVGRPLLLRV
jgi:hypothetical protein